MAGILAKTKILQSQYDDMQDMYVQMIGRDNNVAGVAYPLFLAYDRDIIIDEIAMRAADTGTAAAAVTFKRAASGTSGATGTAISASQGFQATAADDTNGVFTLYNDTADVADPRVIRAGECLFAHFTDAAGGPNEVIFYIRWHAPRTGD